MLRKRKSKMWVHVKDLEDAYRYVGKPIKLALRPHFSDRSRHLVEMSEGLMVVDDSGGFMLTGDHFLKESSNDPVWAWMGKHG